MVRVCSSHTGFSSLTIRALMHSIASTCLTQHGNLVITACSNRVIKEGDDGAEPFHNQAAKHRLGRLSSWKRCTWYRDLLPLPTDPLLADGPGAGPVSGAEEPARHCTSLARAGQAQRRVGSFHSHPWVLGQPCTATWLHADSCRPSSEGRTHPGPCCVSSPQSLPTRIRSRFVNERLLQILSHFCKGEVRSGPR